MPNKSSVFQLKVTLRGTRPPIWRRLLVASDTSLAHLHFVLQIAMGWTDSHLHQFSSGGTQYGRLRPELDLDVEDETAVPLSKILKRPKQHMIYEYDFGDSWEHDVVLEKALPVQPHQDVPRCIGGACACPPEDCGGIPGYYNFLQAMTDPKHPEHSDMAEWYGSRFDPEEFDVEAINRQLHAARSRAGHAV